MATTAATTDVVVIGGGPAGLATAIAARLRGLQVMVLEAAHPPIDKVCGEGLMPDAVAALQRLGITITPEDGAPFLGIRFVAGARGVEAPFPYGVGVGLRRWVLHQRLMNRARALGVGMRWGTPVRTIAPVVVYGQGERLTYRWLIAADGIQSATRRRMGLHHPTHTRRRLGFQCHYRVPPWSPYVEMHWSQHCQAGITPVGSNEVSVCLLTQDTRYRFNDLFLLFPHIAAHIHGAEPTTAVRGASTGNCRFLHLYQDNMILVGDASGSVDAVTGEGLSLAFQQAEALAEALVTGDLAHYATTHRRLARRPWHMASLMLLLDSHQRLRHRAIYALATIPEAFAYLLAYHVGQSSRAHMGWRAPLAFGWKFLTG
jgi:flavin-dependent dehydrogenase